MARERSRSTKMKLVCLISAKNLGDAVGHASVLLELSRRGFAERFMVWTKPESAFLFERVPDCKIVTCPFPMGTGRNFRWIDTFAVWSAARRIRHERPDATLDLVGDVRERWLARLAGSRRHLHIGWGRGHPFENLIRNPFGRGAPVVSIPSTMPNVYDAYEAFVNAICPDDNRGLGATPSVPRLGPMQIGLHPFASQECKLWPTKAWQELAKRLMSDGHQLTAFCAPRELEELRSVFEPVGGNIELSASSLRNFDHAVSRLDLMIGLDSFSVHMAERSRVRTIMLNSGNPPTLWKPPNGHVLGHGGGCIHHPCYNVPKCSSSAQYVCVRSVQVNDVLVAVERSRDKVLRNPAARPSSAIQP
jgi:heptosyltransferase-3